MATVHTLSIGDSVAMAMDFQACCGTLSKIDEAAGRATLTNAFDLFGPAATELNAPIGALVPWDEAPRRLGPQDVTTIIALSYKKQDA